MSDRTIRAGVRDLLASGDVDAISPEQAQSLAELLASRGFFDLQPAMEVLYHQASLMSQHLEENPGWDSSAAMYFVGFTRAWLGVLMARDILRGNPLTGQRAIGWGQITDMGWPVAQIDVDRMRERLDG